MNPCESNALIAYDEALEQITARISATLRVTNLPLKQAFGSVLAHSIVSQIDVPGCAMSAMDGYAINTADLAGSGPSSLPLSQRIAAGSKAEPLAPGSAARIFTGAPVPRGADAVIMQERVEVDGEVIRFEQHPAAGSNIRPAGNDIRSGDVVLQKGCRLRAQEIGLAASVGLNHLLVFAPIRVAIFFTGDELVEPGQALASGQIYDSNHYTLYCMLKSLGCDIVDMGLVADNLEATKLAMLEASERADLVITTGGVSVGEEDHVRIALEALGELRLWRLAIKPGKPLAYGQIGKSAFIGLPGNPVSVFATFCLFVCPVISVMQGRGWKKPVAFSVSAGFDWPKPDSRREFLRARLEVDGDGKPVAKLFPNQDSAVLTSTVWADGFVEISENQTLRAGDAVSYLPFVQFFA